MRGLIINKYLLYIIILCTICPVKILGNGTFHTQQPINYTNAKTNESQSLNPDIKTDRFDWDPFIYLFGILLSASMIVWQMNRQHRNNIELQRENNREKLRLDIYNEFRKTISVALKKVLSMHTNTGSIVSKFKINADFISKGLPLLPIDITATDYSNAHFAACKSIQNLTDLLAEYEIIKPDLEIFQTAFSCTHFEILEKFNPLYELLLAYLPISIIRQDQAEHGVYKKIPPRLSDPDLKKLSDTANDYQEAIMDAASYIGDLTIETQNIFLGELFKHRLSRRKPIDPRMVVVSTSPEDIVKLEKFFNEETEWGKSKKQAEEDAKRIVNKELQNN